MYTAHAMYKRRRKPKGKGKGAGKGAKGKASPRNPLRLGSIEGRRNRL